MRNRLRNLFSDTEGSTLIEFSGTMLVMFMITFGIVEAGYVLYQYNIAQKATQIGARYAATRPPVVTGLSDCGVATSANAGTDCINVAGSTAWAVTCQGGGGGNCNGTIMAEILAEMQKVHPNIAADNVKIIFSGTGLGYVGRGKPVPAITISIENLQYDYVALGQLIGLSSNTLNLDTAQTTVIAEDIGNGEGA